jgi:hypothetical protein
MTTQHVLSLLFAWVFVNQAGVPIPVVPSLLAAGAYCAMIPPSTVRIAPVVHAASSDAR